MKKKKSQRSISGSSGARKRARSLVQSLRGAKRENIFALARDGNLDHMRKFLDSHKEIDLNIIDGESKMTPLMYGAAYGQLDAVMLLLSRGALTNVPAEATSALHLAAFNGHDACVEAILSAGCLLDKINEDRNTPLHMAAGKGHYKICRLIVSGGAEVSIQNAKGDTPLHKAAQGGYEHIVKYLLKHGADVDLKNSQLKTAADVGRVHEKVHRRFQKFEKSQSERFGLSLSVVRGAKRGPNAEKYSSYFLFGKPDMTFYDLYVSSFLSDIEICINEFIYVNAHRCIVSSIPFFRKLMEEVDPDEDEGSISFVEKGVEEEETVTCIMKYVYGDPLDISICPAGELNLAWRMASAWGLKDLADSILLAFRGLKAASALAVMAGVKDPDDEDSDDDDSDDEDVKRSDPVSMEPFVDACVDFAKRNWKAVLAADCAKAVQVLKRSNGSLHAAVMRAAEAAQRSAPGDAKSKKSKPSAEGEGEGEGEVADAKGAPDDPKSSLQVLKEHLSELLVKNESTDLVLKSSADGREFRVHKIVLSRYKVFKEQLARQAKRKGARKKGVEDQLSIALRTEYIKFLLQYIYSTDLIKPSIQVVVNMSVIAEGFQMPGLEQLCYRKLKGMLTSRNLYSVLAMCAKFLEQKTGLAKLLLRFWNARERRRVEDLESENYRLRKQNESMLKHVNLLKFEIQRLRAQVKGSGVQ